MSEHLARAKVKRALHHNPPPSADQTYQPGDEVLVWRENQVEYRIGEWIGPYTVVTYDVPSKVVVVQKDIDSAHERFSVTQVKPFMRPDKAATVFLDTFHVPLTNFANPNERPPNVRPPIKSILSS